LFGAPAPGPAGLLAGAPAAGLFGAASATTHTVNTGLFGSSKPGKSSSSKSKSRSGRSRR